MDSRNSKEKVHPTALVTGSSSGIGEAIVKKLAELDYKLIVTGRSVADIMRVSDECASLSPSNLRPMEIVADLANEKDVDRLFQSTMEHFGGTLNLLVNNAAIGQPVSHELPDECYDNYKRLLQINLNACIRLTLLAGDSLKRSAIDSGRSGNVVNISSIASIRPGQALFAYSTTKAALNMFSNCMAAELAPLVRVNCISPGPVETKIIERSGFSLEAFRENSCLLSPLKCMGKPEDVAESVLFLADSARAAYITGANLVVDGGVMVSPFCWDPSK